MAVRTVKTESLTAVAEAIREKSGTDDMLNFPNGFVQAVQELKTKPDLQAKEVVPIAQTTVITADTGYDGLSSVTVVGDEQLVAGNIKRGVEIFGVTGSYSGPGSNAAVASSVTIRVNGDAYTLDGMPQYGPVRTKADIGTTIALEYTGSGQFLHWIDQEGKIIGAGEKTCTYSINAETTLTAVLLSDVLPGNAAPYHAYIEFMSEYTQVMGAGVWGSADSSEQHKLPKTAMKIGEKALGWTLDGQNVCTVQDIINCIDGSFAYREIRALYERIVVPVTVTVGNNIDDNTFTVAGERGARAILNKPSTGYEAYNIHYWSWDKEGLQPIGYNGTNYGIYASHDTTVYIQYVPVGTPVERLSGVAITAFYPAGEEGDLSIITTVVRDIASGCTVKTHGVIYAFNGDVEPETAEQVLMMGSGVAKVMMGTVTSRRSSYSARIAVSTPDTVLWIRGFCTFIDPNGVTQTIYTRVRSGTYAELMELEPMMY